MDDYDCVRKSSLKFKGERKKKKKKKRPHPEDQQHGEPSSQQPPDERAEDADKHGGWWKVDRYEHIRDDVAIEFIPGCYAKALSNGKIVLGDPHPPGDGPDEEEIFTAIASGTTQVAFKSGFGRYLTIDTRNRLMGLAEAVGGLESFMPVLEEGKLALCSSNDCFLSPDASGEPQQIVARATTVSASEMINIRISTDPQMFSRHKDKSVKSEDLGAVYEAGLGFLKKTKMSLDEEERKRLKKARADGQLREALLDARVKRKSDQFCK